MQSFRRLLCLAAISFFATFASGQDLPDVATGLQPYTSYHGGDLDKVNTQNGGLSIHIPLVSYPQKGSLALSYSVVFNSFSYQGLRVCIAGTAGFDPSGGEGVEHNGCTSVIQLVPSALPSNDSYDGPQLVMDQQLYAVGASAVAPGSSQPYALFGRYYVVTSDNAQHPLANTGSGFRSIDQAGYIFQPSETSYYPAALGYASVNYLGVAPVLNPAAGVITDAHGIKYNGSTITDPDGNMITSGSTGTVDSVGRTIPGFASVSGTPDCPTLPSANYQPLNSEWSWTIPGPNGQNVNYYFCYASVNISTAYYGGQHNPNGLSDLKVTETFLQSIVLPNGQYWGFVFDSANTADSTSYAYGQLMKLILPTGGSVSYTYSNTGQGPCGNVRNSIVQGNTSDQALEMFMQQVKTRTKSDNLGHSATWQYSGYGAGSPGGTTTILAPADSSSNGDATQITYTADESSMTCASVQTQEAVYSGNSSSSKLLRTKVTSYSYPIIPGVPYASAPLETSETTTWANGNSSTVTKGYAPGIPISEAECIPNNNCTSNETAVPSNSPYSTVIGEPTSETYTDYSGTTLKQDSNTFQWQNNPNYLTANLLDIPAQTETLDAYGNVVEKKNYAYDETSYSSGGVRGHPTTLKSWLNTGTSPVTHTGWNANGMKAYFIDGNGNKNSYGHTDDYSYNQCSGSRLSDTYNALNQHVSATYDCNSGLILTYTDANRNPTSFTWDEMGRILSATYPDGGSTSYTYEDSTNTVKRAILATPDPTQTEEVIFDGLGREVRRDTTNIFSPNRVDTAYDSNGRVYSISNPYNSTSDTSYGLTTYLYDAIGRKTIQTNPDLSTKQWCYDGIATTGQSNCHPNVPNVKETWVDAADENGNDWQQTSDALGRLLYVAEPNGTAKTPAMLTDYVYDPLNNLLSVTQNGGTSDTARTARTFNYDSLSRLVCSSNPENSYASCPSATTTAYTPGTTGYTYDANGNLLQKISPGLNGATGAQTLGYCYDKLNRMVGEWSAAPPSGCGTTPTSVTSSLLATYTFDSSNLALALNTVGRLVDEKAYLNGTLISENSPFNYDAMGRNLEEQLTPYRPSNTNYDFIYGYDVAGAVNCTNNGFAALSSTSTCANYTPIANSITATYAYNLVGQLTSESAGTPCSSGTCTPYADTQLFGNAVYGGAGILSASYGNGLNMTQFYDNRMRVMDHEVFNSTDTFGWATVLIAGTEQTGDTGTVTVTVAGVPMSVSYGSTSTATSIASALIGVINQNQNTLVSAAICNSGTCPAVPSSQLSQTIRLEAILAGTSGDVSIVTTQTNTSGISFTATANGSVLQNGSGSLAYFYRLQYAPNGNITQSDDDYNGYEINGYDTLNRLTTSQRTYEGPINGTNYQYQCWLYDGFGNRLSEADQNSGCTGTTPVPSASNYVKTAVYNASNQITTASGDGPTAFTYDLAGNVTNDSINQYVYDVEGRICAVKSSTGTSTQYVYDAEGRRVAKGTIPALPAAGSACAAPTAANGFALTNVYLRGLHGDQDTELDGSGNWLHTNIFAAGGLTATYWSNGTNPPSYAFSDWLGTKRLQTNNNPSPETYWKSDPWGDYLYTYGSGGDATEHHFTGKERDTESGLDYFGARYYSPAIGRFLSPDWSAKEDPVPYVIMDDPQSLNLYSYVRNNPLSKADPDGHCPWCLAAAGGGILADEAPLAFTGPVGWTVIGVTAVAVAGVAIYQHMNNEAPAPAATPVPASTPAAPTSPAPTTGTTPLPTGIVGTDPSPTKGRTNSGPLAPDNGGTGDAGKDFGTLTGGKSGPAPQGSTYPAGTQVGENGIALRPAAGKSGPRIDIPANGSKPHETLHYPPPPPQPTQQKP